MRTPQMPCISLPSTVFEVLQQLSEAGSHGTTAALQAFPFVTATNGASAFGFVSLRVCVCVIVGSYTKVGTTNSLKNTGATQHFFSFFIFNMFAAAAVPVSHDHTVIF